MAKLLLFVLLNSCAVYEVVHKIHMQVCVHMCVYHTHACMPRELCLIKHLILQQSIQLKLFPAHSPRPEENCPNTGVYLWRTFSTCMISVTDLSLNKHLHMHRKCPTNGRSLYATRTQAEPVM